MWNGGNANMPAPARGQTPRNRRSSGPYPEIKQAVRVRGNSTFNTPSADATLMPRPVGYRSFASGVAKGIFVVAGPSILQTASKVRPGDRIPKATGAF